MFAEEEMYSVRKCLTYVCILTLLGVWGGIALLGVKWLLRFQGVKLIVQDTASTVGESCFNTRHCCIPRILKVCTTWWCVDSFTIRPLYPWEGSTYYPLHRRLGGSQSRSRCFAKEKNMLLLTGFEPGWPNCSGKVSLLPPLSILVRFLLQHIYSTHICIQHTSMHSIMYNSAGC
jgi:hypothetical protein